MAFEFLLPQKKKKKKFWFQDNEDAQGYRYGDNRAVMSDQQVRRETVRRTWNI
jgi:hypothetical protein